jgi:murein DD-endopeptidase MepM/ murein hydrolase activator NlpD
VSRERLLRRARRFTWTHIRPGRGGRFLEEVFRVLAPVLSFARRGRFGRKKVFPRRRRRVHSVWAGLVFILLIASLALNAPWLKSGSGEEDAGLGQPAESYLAVYLEAPPEGFSGDEDIPQVPPKNVLSFTAYIVEKGDTISGIAQKLELNQDSLISCNGIEQARTIQPGMELRVPNMNGIMHTVKAEESLQTLAENYKVPQDIILEVNNITEFAHKAGEKIFIPDAKLSAFELRRVWGELFRYPLRGWITSRYGYRADPFTRTRRFHNGIDIAGPAGAPIYAAMEGRVIETGYNNISGNYVIITHPGGYTTSYAHMSLIRAEKGQWVKEGQRIGDVGSTGYSTGNHLHFSISRWGKSMNPALLLY